MPTAVSLSASSRRTTGTIGRSRANSSRDGVSTPNLMRRPSGAAVTDGSTRKKQVRSPVWQAAPSWSTSSSRVSPSQSTRTSCTHCRLPEVSPLTQYSCRLRDQ